jgi:hypothetical protein
MTPTSEEEHALATFLSACVKQILRHQDSDTFFAWLRGSGPALLPDLFAAAADERAQRALVHGLGTTVWNATPLPANGFRPRILPGPERNAACPCGSGEKYKRCCARVPPFPTIPAEAIWSLAARHLPARQMQDLASRGALPPQALVEAAVWFQEVGRPKQALRLLEPAFESARELDSRYEPALDLLLDLYDETGQSEHKRRTMERLAGELRPPLRAALWMRLASIAAGEHDPPAAWDFFRLAQKDDPENLNLAHLEVMLLLEEGRSAEAAERARYWLAWMRRRDLDATPRLTSSWNGRRLSRSWRWSLSATTASWPSA